MNRSRILFTLVAVSLLASACTVQQLSASVVGCKDLSVGEHAELDAFGASDVDESSWTITRGPGTLITLLEEHKAVYTATEPGSVVITFEAHYTYDILNIPISGEFYTGRCEFEVFDATFAPAEGTGYEVTAVVTVSTVEGILFPIGAESAAIWRLVFDCPDGRCDAEVHDGGPYGGLAPFMATYQDDMENFVFDFVLDTPANETCGDDRWVGEINPLGWDDQGPVEFTFTMVNVLTCDSGDLVVEWEGEATRG